MKKIKTTLTIVLMVTMIFSISGCSLFYNPTKNDGNNSSNKNNKTTITIYDGDISNEFEVEYGKQAEVTALTKQGYYLLGYYTEPNGGEKYFDLNGKSMQVWQENMPTTFYAHWASISGLTYNSEVDCTDEAESLSFYSTCFYYELPDDFKNAINGNLNKDLNVTVHFKAKEKLSGVLSSYAPVTIRLQDGSGDSASTYAKQKLTPTKEYESYDLNFTVDAGSFKKGVVYVIFDLGYANTNLYLKDISITTRFN